MNTGTADRRDCHQRVTSSTHKPDIYWQRLKPGSSTVKFPDFPWLFKSRNNNYRDLIETI